MESSESSSDTTSVPSECANERLGEESKVSVDQLNASVESVPCRMRTTRFLNRISECSGRFFSKDSSSLAPADCHEVMRSNAAELFSGNEVKSLSPLS